MSGYGRCGDCGGICVARATRCRGCARAAQKSGAPTKATARRRAQRAHPVLIACAHCGRTDLPLARHHPDIESRPDDVIALCWPCHRAEDRRLGKWSKGWNGDASPERRHSTAQVRDAIVAVLCDLGLEAHAAEVSGAIIERLRPKTP